MPSTMILVIVQSSHQIDRPHLRSTAASLAARDERLAEQPACGIARMPHSAAMSAGSECGFASTGRCASRSRAEMADEALDRPGRRVAERADRVALDLLGDFQQHVDLALLRAALGHARQHAPHPARALAARRALAAALVLVEIGDARDRPRRCRSTCRARSRPPCRGRICSPRSVSKSIGASMICSAGTSGTEEPPGIDAEQVVPAAAHAAAMAVDQLAEGDAHLLLDVARLVRRARRRRRAWCRCCSWLPRPRTSRRRAAGSSRATAIDSTLLTVVGQP